MQKWRDADAREAFVKEIEINFSLIAPAGVGKTHSIVQRVLEIAQRDPQVLLPQLVVVTYTRRAAQEMQDRVYAELLELRAGLQVFEAMDQAFFGTIHAYCARLLRLYGFYIGLPAMVELVTDPLRLWKEFLFSLEGAVAIEEGVNALGVAIRHVHIQEILTTPPPDTIAESTSSSAPLHFDFSELLSERHILEARSDVRENVRAGQLLAAQWVEKFENTLSFLPLPSYSKGGKKFLLAWETAFAPIESWVQSQIQCALRKISLKYRDWRLCQGRLLYSDQIEFTAQLLQHPRARALLQEQKISVILDEAQDTDPVQFRVLFEISDGHISLVGDPQQCIYGDRADLRVYQKFQRQLLEAPQGKELHYQVSFRCRSAILDFVNQAGSQLLSGENGQVEFVPLQSACTGDKGQVLRIPFPSENEKIQSAQAKELIANEVATWLRKTGLEALRARDWSEVAVLCPRKRWLETLGVSLKKEGFSVQTHSERSLLGDSPVYAWWTSLFWVLTHPTDFYEVVGLLREVFAISDAELAALCGGDSSRLQPDVAASFHPLQLLGELVKEVKNLPLRSAVDLALRKTCLLERLLSLPGEDSTFMRNRHSELLLQASDAEIRALTLRNFAQELRDHFEDATEPAEVLPGAIQLITCQKAKGLEWDAVVVPYFYRKISFRMANPISTANEEACWTARKQEMQRLLYVTLTRARNTLVFFDDSVYFSSKEKTKAFSFAQILGEKGLKAFQALPQQAESGTTCEGPLPVETSSILETSDLWLENARRVAMHFPRKITPHRLAQEVSLNRETTFSKNSGRDYGIWWHECAESLPLHRPDWRVSLEKLLENCPDPVRGRSEWEMFFQSFLAERLANKKYFLYREMPLFFCEDTIVVEGVIDLAAFDADRNSWLLIDWKTDRGVTVSELLLRYRDQLATYARCLGKLTGAEIIAGFYAVSLGEWIPLSGE